MATPWNFLYNKLTAPEAFNKRPTRIYSNISYNATTGLLSGFTSEAIIELDRILSFNGDTCTVTYNDDTTPAVFGTHELDYSTIDLTERTIKLVTPFAPTDLSNKGFTFNSDPGFFTEVLVPLTGQNLHDNFFFLAEGLTNHQERIETIEDYRATSLQGELGYIAYNGFTRKKGEFYGGDSLEIEADTAWDSTVIYTSTTPNEFFIAVDDGVSDTPIFYTMDVAKNKLTYIFSNINEYCDYINTEVLVNNSSTNGFAFSASTFSTSGYPADWNAEPQEFYIVFDDSSDKIKITLDGSEKPTSLEELVSILNFNFLGAGISTKIIAEQNSGRLILRGINNRDAETNQGCSRIKLENIPGGTALVNVLQISPSSIFDFSKHFEFVPSSDSTKVVIKGLNDSFKAKIKDDRSVLSGLYLAGFHELTTFTGTYISYHSEVPESLDATLNFDGVLKVTKLIISDSSNFSTLPSLTISGLSELMNAEIQNLTVTGSNATEDNVLFNDFKATGSVELGGSLEVTGATNLNGITTIDNTLSITGDKLVTDYNVFYRPATWAFPAINTGDTSYLAYNGNFAVSRLFVTDYMQLNTIYSSQPAESTLFLSANSSIGLSGTSWLNFSGNFKAVGLVSNSSRELKTNIYDATLSALDLLEQTKIVMYNFKTDLEAPHIGFIAEDTDPLLSGTLQKSFDITNSIGVLMKAVQELYAMIKG